jgi:hypothetical protein
MLFSKGSYRAKKISPPIEKKYYRVNDVEARCVDGDKNLRVLVYDEWAQGLGRALDLPSKITEDKFKTLLL